MDTAALAAVGLVVAAIALALAGGAFAAARSAAAASHRLAADLVELRAAHGSPQSTAAALAERLDAEERRRDALQTELQTATQRTATVEQRLARAEGHLSQLAAAPPPIPSGRRSSGLDDLRATLRAQAAEAAGGRDAVEDGQSPETAEVAQAIDGE
jgi:hypothetical protein